jgi:hypothetical protein
MLAWFFLVSPTCEGLSPCKCAPRTYERNKSKQARAHICMRSCCRVFISWVPNDPAAAHPAPYLYPSYCVYKKGLATKGEEEKAGRRYHAWSEEIKAPPADARTKKKTMYEASPTQEDWLCSKESPCMNRKIWTALIDLSLHRSTSCFFREEEVRIISSSWQRK